MNPIRPLIRPAALRAGLRPALPRATLRRAAPVAQIGQVRAASTRESVLRDKALTGPFSWKAALLFILTGGGLYLYFDAEKQKIAQKKRDDLASKTIGRPSIGGSFSLIDTNGQEFSEKNLLGKWTLVYFGFTNCPDICPEELDKMGEAVDKIEKHSGEGTVQPVFISVDPARDPVDQVKRYIKEFHPRMVGLTGDYESVKKACKSYRVYFSTPPDAKPSDDYLVDHSIFFYLMDPLGQFVDAFGKATTASEVAQKTRDAMAKWEAAGGNAAAGVANR